MSNRDKLGRFVNAPVAILWTPVSLKGVGGMPFTLAGANKDAACYMWYHNVMKELVNQAAFYFDHDDGPIRQAVEDYVLESQTFKRGTSFLKQNQDGPRMQKALQAQAALQELGIDLKRFNYQRAPERLVRMSIGDNPKMASIIAEEKALKAAYLERKQSELLESKINVKATIISVPDYRHVLDLKMKREDDRRDIVLLDFSRYEYQVTSQNKEIPEDWLDVFNKIVNTSGKVLIVCDHNKKLTPDIMVTMQDGLYVYGNSVYSDFAMVRPLLLRDPIIPVGSTNPIKDYMDDEFGWLKPFDVTFTEPLEYTQSTPICPVAGVDDGIADRVRRIGISTGGDVAAIEVNKVIIDLVTDPLFPSDLRAETVFDIITRPSIIFDAKRVLNALLAMGAEESKASNAAREIRRIMGDFTFHRFTSSYSTRDAVAGIYDKSQVNYQRMVEMISTGDRNFDAVIRAIVAELVMIQPDNLPTYKAKVRFSGSGLLEAKEKILGGLFQQANKHQRIFSREFMMD
jgi:SepF-like predicted cell division protein (DUF552 family)